MFFSLRVALRFLIEGRNQSLFIVIGIAVGVSVIIFIGAIITSLQSNLIEQTLGNSAHITISESNDVFRDIKQVSRFGLIESQPEGRRIALVSCDDLIQAIVGAARCQILWQAESFPWTTPGGKFALFHFIDDSCHEFFCDLRI